MRPAQLIKEMEKNYVNEYNIRDGAHFVFVHVNTTDIFRRHYGKEIQRLYSSS